MVACSLIEEVEDSVVESIQLQVRPKLLVPVLFLFWMVTTPLDEKGKYGNCNSHQRHQCSDKQESVGCTILYIVNYV